MSDVYEQLQYEMLRDYSELLSLTLKLVYPRIGGYNARPYSLAIQMYEPPRASEIKALWRWWMRAVLAGCYGGMKNYDELDKIVGKILGSTDRQSYFTIIVSYNHQELKSLEAKCAKVFKLFSAVLEAFKKFIQEWNEKEKKLIVNYADLKPPFTIMFLLQSEQRQEGRRRRAPRVPEDLKREVHEKLREYFGDSVLKLKLEFVKATRTRPPGLRLKFDRESVHTVECLSNLLKRYGLLSEDVDVSLYNEVLRISRIPRYELLLQPVKDAGEESKLIPDPGSWERVQAYIKRVSEEVILPHSLELDIKVLFEEPVARSPEMNEIKLKFAVATLFLSFVLGGLGSITRRAFGSIVSVEINNFDKRIKEEVELLRKVFAATNEAELKENILNLAKYCLTLARKAFNISDLRELPIPKVPSLIIDKYFKLEVFKCEKDYCSLLESMGRSCLKQSWKIHLNRSPREPGGFLHTWILGLPRASKDTGYFLKGSEGRRPSAINLKFLEAKESRYVVVYGFLSRDWSAGNIIHKGEHYKRGKKVLSLPILKPNGSIVSAQSDEDLVREAFDAAFGFICSIIEKGCSGG